MANVTSDKSLTDAGLIALLGLKVFVYCIHEQQVVGFLSATTSRFSFGHLVLTQQSTLWLEMEILDKYNCPRFQCSDPLKTSPLPSIPPLRHTVLLSEKDCNSTNLIFRFLRFP